MSGLRPCFWSVHIRFSVLGQRDLGEGSCILRKSHQGTVLVIWLIRLHTTTAGVACSIPIQGIKILHAVQYGQKINEERKLDKTYPAGKR